ncbi:hypothetical protein GCM10027284_09650 [Cyclobacterium sediminis]
MPALVPGLIQNTMDNSRIEKLLIDHEFAMKKKNFWQEKAHGLGGILRPMNNLSAHNWIRVEVKLRMNIYQVADEIISNNKLYNDLDNGSKKTA